MKCTITRNEVTPPVVNDYPCLKEGVNTGQIALFVAPKKGMILEGEDTIKRCRAHQTPFYFGEKWANEDQNWRRLPGSFTVTLSND